MSSTVPPCNPSGASIQTLLKHIALQFFLSSIANSETLQVQCLVNSDYTKSSTYTIETMLLYVHSEYQSRWDAEVGIWVIGGIIVRLALRMGYHRDPSNYPNLTPFQGEMRRRIWAFIRQLDTMFSFQLALPSMIRNTDADTALPRNIFEGQQVPSPLLLKQPRSMSQGSSPFFP
jgi:Fungal specific transcription factor domain